MADAYKPNLTTGFNAGEFTPALAGRVDLDDYKYSARLIENFIPQVQGGLKKFYGTRHIATIPKPNDFVFVPFNGADDPLILVFHDGIVSVICSDKYYDTNLKPNINDCSKLRWTQMNDIIYFAHPDKPPFTIQLLGVNRETQEYEFGSDYVAFKEEPFFPIGWRGNYGYDKDQYVMTSGYKTDTSVKTITISTAGDADSSVAIRMPLPEHLSGIVGSVNVLSSYASAQNVLSAGTTKDPANYTIGATTISLMKRGEPVPVAQRTVGSINELTLGAVDDIKIPNASSGTRTVSRMATTGSYSSILKPGATIKPGSGISSGGVTVSQQPIETVYVSAVSKSISQDDILGVVKSVFPDAKFVGTDIVFTPEPGTAPTDAWSLKITQGASNSEYETPFLYSDYGNGTYSVQNHFDSYEEQGAWASLQTDSYKEFTDTNVEGRYIKFQIESSTTGVAAWAEGITVTQNQIVYSDNSYYRAHSAGKCGAIQPTHKTGSRSDGLIMWEYLHSGTGIAKVVEVVDAHTLRAEVITNLPVVSIKGNSETGQLYRFNHFQWSLFGYKKRYPDNVFFYKGRLGYFTSTVGFGCWVTMSKTDEFDDFGTETYGTLLDTDGITSIITGHSDNNINWLLTGERLYCGSYAGEYAITGAKDGTLTPTNYRCTAVASLGGAKVQALKFKELNLFVGTLSNEIYTISYDYTIDDYVPTNIGLMSTHLLDQYIHHWYALNNNDRNIYFLTEAGTVNILNYVKELKNLGYYRLNLNGDVLEIGSSNAGVVSALYFLVKRGDTYTIEREEHDSPSYSICRHTFNQEAPEDVQIVDFSGEKVYVCDLDTAQFYETEVSDFGIVENRGFKNFLVGLPMYCTFHGQPMTGEKLEGLQQKSIAFNIRLIDSGTFEYGTSHDFNLWHKYKYWQTQSGQQYGSQHALLTGDIKVPVPAGYMTAANKGTGPYPNDTGVALNLRCETPEPFTLLMISNVYV